MSLINISLDTNTRAVALTIDGNGIDFKSFDIFARQDDDDVFFTLRQEIPAENGLVTVKDFRLPSPDETDVDSLGLIESSGTEEEVVAANTANFLLVKGVK